MTTIQQMALELAGRFPVERLELSRSGELLFELGGSPEPRWLALGDGEPSAVEPEHDEALPISRRVAELRSRHDGRLLAYRPGRRMVLRVRRPGAPRGSAVLKAVRRGRLATTLERHAAGASAARAAGFEAAEILAVEPPSALFAMRDLGGSRVEVSAAEAPRFHAIGAALADFQRIEDGAALAMHAPVDELAVLDVLAEKALRLTAALPEGWSAGRARLERSAGVVDGAPGVRTHRDLHDKQLLACEGGTALLDFDLTCLADAALDPANLLAHLELRVLQGLAEPDGARACTQAFRDGFDRSRARDLEQRLRWWGAASFLRLTLVYHLRPPWSHLSPRLLERGLRELGATFDGAA